MDKSLNYFANIPLSMIGYVIQFCPINDLTELSKVCKRFKNALKQEFLWEQFAMNDELFLPKEKEQFKWREYFFYLKRLKENIQSGKPNINFKVKPLRSHKDYITAINYLYYGCSYKIISGDNKGIVLTWHKDQDDDYESVTIVDHNEPITQIIIVNAEAVLIDSSTKLTLIKYDAAKDAFEVISQHNKNKEDFTSIEINDGYVYNSGDFHDYHSLPKANLVISCYDPVTWKKANEFTLAFDAKVRAELYSLTEYTSNTQPIFKTKLPSFILMNNLLVVALNYYTLKRYPISILFNQKKIQAGNCFIFDTNKILPTPENIIIPLNYIFNIIHLNKENGLVAFTGNDINNHNSFLLLIYRNDSSKNELLFYQKVYLSFPLHLQELVFYTHSKLIFFDKKTMVRVRHLDSKTEIETIITDKGSDEDINVVVCDQFRIILCYNSTLVDVFNAKTNKKWYSLLTGSSTIIPRSFVAHPTCKGINKILMTRWSIIGVIGNLIREYSFQPTYSYKQK